MTEKLFNLYDVPLKCRQCNELSSKCVDNTKAFDCGDRLRGNKDITVIFYCDEFLDGVDPKNCTKGVVEKGN